MAERTFLLIKSDAVQRCLVGNVITEIENKGFKLVGMKFVFLSDDVLKEMYDGIESKPFFAQYKAVAQSAPCLALIVEGHLAVENGFSFSGAERKPENDRSLSIRNRFAMWTGADVIHRAASSEEVAKNIRMFFREEEIFSYYKMGEEFCSEESWNKYGSRWS